MILLAGRSETMEAQHIWTSSGTEFEAGMLKINAEEQEIRKEVKPEHPQGYYNHYKEQEGYYYHVISGTIKNISDKEIDLDMIKVVAEDEDGNISEAKLVAFNEKMMDFWYSLDGGQEAMFYLFAIVEKEHEVPQRYRIYMDDDGKIEKDQNVFDNCYEFRYFLPKLKEEGK